MIKKEAGTIRCLPLSFCSFPFVILDVFVCLAKCLLIFLHSARQPTLAVRQNAYESSPFSYGSLVVPHG